MAPSCDKCGSDNTVFTGQSWTGRQQSTGPMVTVDQIRCNDCGNVWVW